MIGGIVMAALALGLACLVVQGLSSCTVAPTVQTQVNASWAAPGSGTSSLAVNQRQDSLKFSGTTLTYGTGSNLVNLLVEQDRTLAASSNETLDLYGSTTPLVGVDGGNCLFRHIKYVLIYIVANGDISGLTIGAAASNAWTASNGTNQVLGGTTPTFTIYPNGTPFQLGEPTNGFVVSTTNGQLKIANDSSAVAVTYRIVIAGTTA